MSRAWTQGRSDMLDSLFGIQEILIIEIHDFNIHMGSVPVMVLVDSESGPVSVMAPLNDGELEIFLGRCAERSYKVDRIDHPGMSNILNYCIGKVTTPQNEQGGVISRPPGHA